jgi:hypothetical protein
LAFYYFAFGIFVIIFIDKYKKNKAKSTKQPVSQPVETNKPEIVETNIEN